MRGYRVTLMAALLALTSWAGAQGVVDDERLLGAAKDPANWITFGHDYTNQHFSALNQINALNVRFLVPRWVYQIGIYDLFQTEPLVVDGVMYITTPYDHVIALDAATGKLLWRYEHKSVREQLCCGAQHRGAAVAYGRVYIGTNDGRLIALDQKTGKVVWDIIVAAPDNRPTESLKDLPENDPLRQFIVAGTSGLAIKMPPRVYKGKVIIGVTGAGYGLHLGSILPAGQGGAVVGFAGGFGRRGYLAAYNASTGKEIWRWYTTPDQGWEGEYRETTPDGVPLNRDIQAEKERAAKYKDAALVGGGSTWMTPALDPELGLLFLGVGNPAPQLEDLTRPGDNLYTNSLVALDVETGKLRWYYQQVPHDRWGYDTASPLVLFDLLTDGRTVKAVGQAHKNGWFYVLERQTGRLIFKSEAFVPQKNLFSPPTPEGVVVAPGAPGGASWPPVSYDPRTGLVYIPAIHSPSLYKSHFDPQRPEQRYSSLVAAPGEPTFGTLTAIDTRAGGKIKWQVKTEQPLQGGVLATAGGLVFVGENNGFFDAFDAQSGKLLWQFQTGGSIRAPAISYRVGNTQYVAVAAGGAVYAFALAR